MQQFMTTMGQWVTLLDNQIWGLPLIGLCLGVGLFFSLRSRFAQVRHFGAMVRLMLDGKSSDSGISSFQALSMTLAGRVGTGNIAGVATAIAMGGPGAIFWMWVVAFLGASSAFVESTLGQIYKEKIDGQYRGGPAFYIEKGLGIKWYASLFAVVAMIACGLLLPGTQANAIGDSLTRAFAIKPAVTAAVLTLLLGFIIFGGVRRIARVTQFMVPFMALGYMLVAGVVILLNIEHLPDVIRLILSSAFGVEATFGGLVGMAVQWGVKRGVYSNEAGQGSAPHASSAAAVSHPAKQGLVQAFSIYIDTLFVCTATAFMLLLTGRYNVGPEGKSALFTGAPDVQAGSGFVQLAIESVMPGFGSVFVAVALFFFAFTTILAYYYIAETNIVYLRRKLGLPGLELLLKLCLMLAVVYGTVNSAETAWGLGSIGVGLMAWLNIIAIILLQKPAFAALRDYEAQMAAGVDPVFHPERLGIENADFWQDKQAERDLERQRRHGGQPVYDEI